MNLLLQSQNFTQFYYMIIYVFWVVSIFIESITILRVNNLRWSIDHHGFECEGYVRVHPHSLFISRIYRSPSNLLSIRITFHFNHVISCFANNYRIYYIIRVYREDLLFIPLILQIFEFLSIVIVIYFLNIWLIWCINKFIDFKLNRRTDKIMWMDI